MDNYNEQRAMAAKWLFDRTTKVQYFTWLVLTSQNSDPESLNLEDNIAYHIFTDFVSRGLLIPTRMSIGNSVFAAYVPNLGKQKEWRKAMESPTFFRMWLLPRFKTVGSKAAWIIFGAIISVIIIMFLNIHQPFSDNANVEILGVMPIHLSTKRPKDRNFHDFNHRLALIFKLKNSSSTEANIDFSLIRGCIKVHPLEIDGHLPRNERLFYKRQSIPQDTLKEILDSRKNVVQRISISGFVKENAVVSGHDTNYIGVMFPLYGGAIYGKEGTVSLEGRCEEIEIAHPAPQLFDLFVWRIRQISQLPKALTPEFYSGQLKISLLAGNVLLEVDSEKITRLYHVSNHNWSRLSLPLMYENPGDFFFPPVKENDRIR